MAPRCAAATDMEVRSAIETLKAEEGAEDSYESVDEACNAQLRAYFEVAHHALRVSTVDEAVALLCTSERVCRDLERSLEGGVEMSVCLRAWQPSLRQEYEFRGFVCGGAGRREQGLRPAGRAGRLAGAARRAPCRAGRARLRDGGGEGRDKRA